MNDQNIALLTSKLSEGIDVSGETLSLYKEFLGPVSPGITINLESISLPNQRSDPNTVGSPDVLMKGVKLHIQAEAVDSLRSELDLLAKILHRLSQSGTADLRFTFGDGIDSYGTVPTRGKLFQRILPRLIDFERVMVLSDDPVNLMVPPSVPSQEIPRQESYHHRGNG